MNVEAIRRRVIAALASDDDLAELLVLKGGNALHLVHGIGRRASLDLDYSIEPESLDMESVRAKVARALLREFRPMALVPFDVVMQPRPNVPSEVDERPSWGGWSVEFKLASNSDFDSYSSTLPKLRDRALALHLNQKRFQIDISKCEYVADAATVRFEGYPLRVYPPAMIVFEKLRALCQQLPGYLKHPRPRPRDFVDICAVLATHDNQVLRRASILTAVFNAKHVPLACLFALKGQRAFHAQGWDSVAAELGRQVKFDDFFDRVVQLVAELEALGVVQPPLL